MTRPQRRPPPVAPVNNLFVLAAENSAETYAVQVVEEFKRRHPEMSIFGVGGDKLRDAGMELILHNREFSIVGIVEVLSSIVKLKKYMHLLFKEAVRRKADAVLLVDYPDFNLRLAKKFKKTGIPVYYYISPTVWAWRYSRVKVIKRAVDHMFIIFPFEVDIYKQENIPFTYTGHPMIPGIQVTEGRQEFRRAHRFKEDEIVITLLPGSRESEVTSLLPDMLTAAEILAFRRDIRVCLLKAHNINRTLLQPFLDEHATPVQVFQQDHGYNLIHASDLIITTCGTSNLEIAMLGVPFFAVYHVNALSYLMGKNFLKISLYSIVNILAGREVVAELIQQDYNTQNIVKEALRILDSQDVRERMIKDFSEIRQRLTQDQNPPRMIVDKITGDFTQTKI